MNQPKDFYRSRLDAATGEVAGLTARFAKIGLARLTMFLLAVALGVVVVAQRGGVALYGIGATGVSFVALLIWHERVARAKDRTVRSAQYYARGAARLEDRWLEGGDDGARFLDPNHLYAADLEIFGRGSLYHLVASTRTETGAATLASWLAGPAPVNVIAQRQAAIRELAGLPDLRHDLAVVPAGSGAALDSATLRRWFLDPAIGFPGWASSVTLVLGALNVGLTGVALAGWMPGWSVVPGYLVGWLVVLRLQSRAQQVLARVDRPARELQVVASLLSRVDREQFTGPLLQSLADRWRATGASPVAEIGYLSRLVDVVDARRNQLFMPISGLLLLGTQLAIRIDRWRTRVGPTAVDWLAAVGELEALVSLATHAFEHPDDCYPQLTPAGSGLVAGDLGHVLLPTLRTVRNDLSLGGAVRLVMVSGSNMSGKSTLLKATGINLVLAFAGAPVRARTFATEPFAVGASLVLRDSLLEGRSRFFAEILRLRDIVAMANEGRPALFLLDELLSGTNSHDRAIGARGVLMGLLDRGAVGVVTTHDLALTALADELGARGANWHLEDTLVGGQLRFDYRLKPGVVRRSNALELMKAVGLDVPIER